MIKLLILTEAGDGIGFGHYTRCSAIRNAALNLNIDCLTVVNWIGEQLFPEENMAVSWIDDLETVTNRFHDYDTVIIDSYKLPVEGYQFLKPHFDKLIVIDDYNRISYPADLLINPNVYFNEMDYSNQSAQCYGGEEYIILRDDFRNYKHNSEKRLGNKLLITLGGSDFNNLLPIICEAIQHFKSFHVTVICPEKEKTNILSKKFPHFIFKGSLSSLEMFEEFLVSDIVISGCGQTLHELASLGKPTIGIRVGDDQLLNQAFYFKKGFLSHLISHDDIDIHQQLGDAVKFIDNAAFRKIISAHSRNFIRTNGIDNIISLLFSGYESLSYRQAGEQDCLLYYQWANDPVVRNNAFKSETVLWEDHVKWFKKKLGSQSLMYVFFHQTLPVGQVRIDWDTRGGCIDFSVDKKYRGRGYGSVFLMIIGYVIKKIPGSPLLYGIVKMSNLASLRAFEKAGFLNKKDEIIEEAKCFIFEK